MGDNRTDIKKTTFNITRSTRMLENVLVNQMDIPKANFHRRAIDYYLANEPDVHPWLKITRRSDPHYIKKEMTDQIYLDGEREAQLLEVARQHECGLTIVLFQALLTYCSVQAPLILGGEIIINEN